MSKYFKMVEFNQKASREKIDYAIRTIKEMLEKEEQLLVCDLVRKTGLSRAFFYKNPVVSKFLNEARQQQEGKVFHQKKKVILDLVDGGSSDVKKVGQYRLESFLKSQGVGKLDYVLISHGDSDHMNGVEELIERQDIGVKIRTLVLPVKEIWDETLEELAGKARKHGIRVVVIEPGQSIREGEMAISCIQPGNMEIKSEDAESRQENDVFGTGKPRLESGNVASMVLAVRYGKFDMLLTGDVEGEGEMQLTKQLEESYPDCTWEVLKVAHHGSKTRRMKKCSD